MIGLVFMSTIEQLGFAITVSSEYELVSDKTSYEHVLKLFCLSFQAALISPGCLFFFRG